MKHWKPLETLSSDIPEEFKGLQRRVVAAELVKRVGIIISAVSLVLVVILQALLLNDVSETTNAIRETQQEGSPSMRAVLDTNNTVKDCVEPDGDCRQRQLDEALARQDYTLQVIKASAICAEENPQIDIEEMNSCVINLIGTREDYVAEKSK